MTKLYNTPFIKELLANQLLTPARIAELNEPQKDILRNKKVQKFVAENRLSAAQFDILLVLGRCHYPFLSDTPHFFDLIRENYISNHLANVFNKIHEELIQEEREKLRNSFREFKYYPKKMGINALLLKNPFLIEMLMREMIKPSVLNHIHKNNLYKILGEQSVDILSRRLSIDYIANTYEGGVWDYLINDPILSVAMYDRVLAPEFVACFTEKSRFGTEFQQTFIKLPATEQTLFAREIFDKRLLKVLRDQDLFKFFNTLKNDLLQRTMAIEYLEECYDIESFNALLENPNLYQAMLERAMPTRFVRVYTSCPQTRLAMASEARRSLLSDFEFALCMSNFWVHELFRFGLLSIEELSSIKNTITTMVSAEDQTISDQIPETRLVKERIRVALEKNPNIMRNSSNQTAETRVSARNLFLSGKNQVEIVKKIPELTGMVLTLIVTAKMSFRRTALLEAVVAQKTTPLSVVHRKILEIDHDEQYKNFKYIFRIYLGIKILCLTMVKARNDPASHLYQAPLDVIIKIAAMSVPKQGQGQSRPQPSEQAMAYRYDVAHAYAHEYESKMSKKRAIASISQVFAQNSTASSEQAPNPLDTSMHN